MPPITSLQHATIPGLSLVGVPKHDWRAVPVSKGRRLSDVVKKGASLRNWKPGQKIIIGHRGLRKRLANGQLSVELSASTIQDLIDTGNGRIEIDLSADATGKIWLCHPKDLWEITRYKGLIAETDVSALPLKDRELVRREIKHGQYTDEYEPTGEYLLSLDNFVEQFMECNPNLEAVGDSRDCDPAPVIASVSRYDERVRNRLITQILNFCGDGNALIERVRKYKPATGWEHLNLLAILSHNPGALHKQDDLSTKATDVQALFESSLRWQTTFFDLKNSAGKPVFNILGFDTPVCKAWENLVADQLVYHPVLGSTSDPAIVSMYARYAANEKTKAHNRACFPGLFTITPSAQPTYIDPQTRIAYLSQFHQPELTKQTPETDHRHYWFKVQGEPGNAIENGCDGVISDSPLAEFAWYAKNGHI